MNENFRSFFKGKEILVKENFYTNPPRASVIFIDAGARLGELYKMHESDIGSYFKVTEDRITIREDLGSHVDYAFLPFKFEITRPVFTDAEFHLFEPNPNFFDDLCETAKWLSRAAGVVYVHKVACSTDNKPKTFKISDGGWGSTIRNDKQHEKFVEEVEVQSIDFVEFLKKINGRDITEEIHIKMDIEGSEYNVLPTLFNNWGHIDKIKSLSVEFHADYFPEADKEFWGNKAMTFAILQLGKNDVKFNWWPGEW